ncbi:MAG: hypothetical protein KF891_22645 [Rhizobacter sp.]|nr:hypothetical protein [Rhizobacter sp.]
MATPTKDRPMPRTLRQVFAVPALLALTSVVGLVSALVGDGPWDALSWAGLGSAAAAGLWCALPWRRPADRSARQGR